MWNGMLQPKARKSVGFLDTKFHSENPTYEVTEVFDGVATVVVYFNHTCHYDGKTYEPASNGIGYQYEYEVGSDVPDEDNVEAQRRVEEALNGNLHPSPKEIIDLLDTVDVIV